MLTLVTRPLFIAVTGLIICFNSYAAPNFLQASTYTLANSAYRYAFSDFENTAHSYLDALTPGANTIGQSGHNFTSPVPLSS